MVSRYLTCLIQVRKVFLLYSILAKEGVRAVPKQTEHQLRRNSNFLGDAKNLTRGSRALRLLGLILTVAVCLVVAASAHVYFSVQHAAEQTYRQSGIAQSATLIQQKRPVSILILGVDQGIENRHDRGNSDTMILATANPQKKKATLTSIPRDLLTDVLGDKDNKYYMSRVNASYEFGGSRGAVITTQALLNVPVNYYMEVNMKALESLVDAVGGVGVNVPFGFKYHTRFHKGHMHLNGKQALDYARMRKSDPKGDYGRQTRQRQIILAVVHEAMSVKTVNNYRRILRVFAKYVKTNMTFSDMVGLAINYRDCTSTIDSGHIQGHDAWIGGAAMQVAPTKELQRVSDLVRTNLDLKKERLRNQETRQNRLNRKHHLKWSDPTAFDNYIIYEEHSHQPWNG